MSHQSKANFWNAVFFAAIMLVIMAGVATITLTAYDLLKQDKPTVNCCCPTQQAMGNEFLLLPFTTSTPTPTSTMSATPYGITRIPGDAGPTREPTFTPRPPKPTRTPYHTPMPTRTNIPTYTPVPPTQIPLLAHWHLKNDNAKLYCEWSDKGHKPNIEWYLDYDSCMAAAGGH